MRSQIRRGAGITHQHYDTGDATEARQGTFYCQNSKGVPAYSIGKNFSSQAFPPCPTFPLVGGPPEVGTRLATCGAWTESMTQLQLQSLQ